jgi:protein-S-isoprenylcysteine O-methyltransferase Ste14
MTEAEIVLRRPALPRDWLTRAAVAIGFFLLASLLIRQLFTNEVAKLDALGFARLASNVCLVSFFLMISWLTLIRPAPRAKARGWFPRVAAILGTWLITVGLLFLPRRTDLGLPVLAVSGSLILLGGILAVVILRHLGRSFSIMAEARRLVTDGPYSIVRHPLYAAELIATLGVFLQFASIPAALLVMTQFGFQVLRMRNEEAVLGRTFPNYADYKARTARLIPGLW